LLTDFPLPYQRRTLVSSHRAAFRSRRHRSRRDRPAAIPHLSNHETTAERHNCRGRYDWGSLRHPRSAQARSENVSQREADDRLALDTPSACSNVCSPGHWGLPRRRSRSGGFVARALGFRRSAMSGSATTKWSPASTTTTSLAVGVFISAASGCAQSPLTAYAKPATIPRSIRRKDEYQHGEVAALKRVGPRALMDDLGDNAGGTNTDGAAKGHRSNRLSNNPDL